MSSYQKSASYFLAYLASSLAKGGSETTIYLSTIQTLTGETITTADFADLDFGEITIDPLTTTGIESCTFTGVDGTAISLTGVTRGLSAKGDDVSAARKPYHPIGTLVILTFGVQTLNNLYNKGLGDVRGPSSATDNAIARFDGTTGKLLQNSGTTIDDAGNIFVHGDIMLGNGNNAVDGNTVFGKYAMAGNNSGVGYNTAVGFQALSLNTTGNYNVALGWLASYANTTGYTNVAIGRSTLKANQTGAQNVALGNMAGQYATGDNELYIDNQDRTNTAGDKANAIIFGEMASAAINQKLHINAVVMPVQAANGSAPSYVKGGMYFNTTSNKMMIGGATGWETVTSA